MTTLQCPKTSEPQQKKKVSGMNVMCTGRLQCFKSFGRGDSPSGDGTNGREFFVSLPPFRLSKDFPGQRQRAPPVGQCYWRDRLENTIRRLRGFRVCLRRERLILHVVLRVQRLHHALCAILILFRWMCAQPIGEGGTPRDIVGAKQFVEGLHCVCVAGIGHGSREESSRSAGLQPPPVF
jgi:hypothetical protein